MVSGLKKWTELGVAQTACRSLLRRSPSPEGLRQALAAGRRPALLATNSPGLRFEQSIKIFAAIGRLLSCYDPVAELDRAADDDVGA